MRYLTELGISKSFPHQFARLLMSRQLYRTIDPTSEQSQKLQKAAPVQPTDPSNGGGDDAT